MSKFQTTDLNLGAVIIVLTGAQLIGVDKDNPRKVKFIFERKDGMDDIIEAYWKRELSVEPIGLALAQQYLKDKIHSGGDEY